MTDYKLISADSHVSEPTDLWVERVEKKYRDRAPRLMTNPSDPDRMERITLVIEVRAVRIGRVLHETRRAVTILLLHALDPQVRGLAHVRIGGDQLVVRHPAPPSTTEAVYTETSLGRSMP